MPKNMFRCGGRRQSFVSGESRTKQSFATESDVNVIVAKYVKTGIFPRVNPAQPRFGDFSSAQDYHTTLNRLIEANMLFDQLPSDVRAACRNNPEELLAMIEDPERQAELQKLGILEDVSNGKAGHEAKSTHQANDPGRPVRRPPAPDPVHPAEQKAQEGENEA